MTTVRTFTALDLVRLPRLDANEAQSLVRAMLAAAETVTLSDGAKEALGDVSKALAVLVEAAGANKHAAPATKEGPTSREADSKLDSAWVGTHDWLNGWARLPDEPKAAIAAELRRRLFPDGVKFTRFTFPRQWAESNTRLTLIDDAELERSFDALGGRAFLQALRETHKAYGEALGITKAQEEEVRATRIRDALEHVADTLRAYVLQVSAMERKSDPSSSKTVEQLLRPLATWQSPAPRPQSAPKPEPEAPKPDANSPSDQGTC